MAITSQGTLIYDKTRNDPATGTVIKSAVTYYFASVTADHFTYPVDLAGAKSVHVTCSTAAAAEFYIAGYESGEIDIDTDPTARMAHSLTGVGLNVVEPSANGGGLIGGSLMPPSLSVKNKHSGANNITIHITY